MNNIEITFFEEYKKLDNLCKDLLGSNQGITQYVNEYMQLIIRRSCINGVQKWQRKNGTKNYLADLIIQNFAVVFI